MPKFKSLIIDPPWPYAVASKHKKLSGFVSQDGNAKYKTLTIEDLKSLPINELMDEKQAYVFLWTTSPFIPDALELLKAWNFVYVTSLVWHKNTGIGVGFWFRGDHEYVFVAKRAGAPSIRTMERSHFTVEPVEDLTDYLPYFPPDFPSHFSSKRLKHSSKPTTIHELIEKRREPYVASIKRKNEEGNEVVTQQTTITSFPGPYIEIFGRSSREGWTVLGDQSPEDGNDIRDSLCKLIEQISKE